jgi:general secretion pathway protein E
MLINTHDANRIKEEALSNQMTTLRYDGLQKVLRGMTTIEEVIRVTEN